MPSINSFFPLTYDADGRRMPASGEASRRQAPSAMRDMWLVMVLSVAVAVVDRLVS